ncbi:unnamed protein product [marine sediment metagenome]|uniref:Uncharacterized protein n=1 Tax=marine sediment metagenome TaxID=412755 RepID=X1UIT4_9ZZZZ
MIQRMRMKLLNQKIEQDGRYLIKFINQYKFMSKNHCSGE